WRACRSRSRTCSRRAGSAPPAGRGSWPTTSRRTTPPRSGASWPRARSSSGRRTATSSPWARRPRTPASDRFGTRGPSIAGPAAAVAADLAAGALGTDTGGSVRQPGALCGVVALRPTYGRVSRYGLVAFASSLDQIGPLTKDVRDAALLLEIIAGPDPLDST